MTLNECSGVDAVSLKQCHYLGSLLKAGFGSAGLLRARPTHLDGPRFSISQPISSRSALPSLGLSQGNWSLGVDGLRQQKDEAAARVFSAAAGRAQAAQDSGGESELDASLRWNMTSVQLGAASH